LRAARAQVAAVAHAVLMLHVAVQHVGKGDEAAMGMRREPGDVFVRVVAAKVVQHEKRIEVFQRRRADGAMHGYACTLGHFNSRNQYLHGADHKFSFLWLHSNLPALNYS
jgi:hypothetical protein